MTTNCTARSGTDPVWRGRPSQKMVAAIQKLFLTDEHGRRKFSFHPGEFSVVLDRDFPEVNRVLDSIRAVLNER